MYPAEMEILEDPTPYVNFAEILSDAGIFAEMASVLDVGCATGHLIAGLDLVNPSLKVAGIEYFPYQKANAPLSVRDRIMIHDLRLPLSFFEPYDVVICTEVA